jgi:UrcA family protein
MKRMILAVAMVLAMGAAPALAKDDTSAEARAVPVSYSDLDVSQTSDAQALLSRLRNAAMRACEVSATSRPAPSLRRAIEECRSATLDSAVADANSTEVSRLHSEQRR